MYEQGLEEEEIRKLFRLIDWMMDLPPALDRLFWVEVASLREERTMPFIITPERLGIKRGLMQAIEDALRVKFGEEGVTLIPEIQALEDIEKYRQVHMAAVSAATLDDVRRALAEAAAPPPEPKKKRSRRSGS
jgi:hypothetical protein